MSVLLSNRLLNNPAYNKATVVVNNHHAMDNTLRKGIAHEL